MRRCRQTDRFFGKSAALCKLGFRLWLAGMVLRVNRRLIEVGSSTGLFVWGLMTMLVYGRDGVTMPWSTPLQGLFAGGVGLVAGLVGLLCLISSRGEIVRGGVLVVHGALWAVMGGVVMVQANPGLHALPFSLVLYVIAGAVSLRAGMYLGSR